MSITIAIEKKNRSVFDHFEAINSLNQSINKPSIVSNDIDGISESGSPFGVANV